MPNFNGIYSGNGFSDRMRDRARDMLRRTFKRAITYKELDKYNSNGTVTNDFPIQMAKSSNKLKKYKNFISHPDYPITYGDLFKLEDYFLIVTELNDNNQISEDGVMWKCNEQFKWKFDGSVYEQQCYIDKRGVTLSDSDENFTTLNNKIIVYVQNTDDIKNIRVNQDFVFGEYFKTVYKAIDIDDSLGGLLVITMNRVQASVGDNLVDNIADNPNSDSSLLRVDSELDDSYYLLTPKTAEIRHNTTTQVSIEHYDSLDNIIATNFSYNVSGLTSDEYTLTVVDNNNVEITNNGSLGEGLLEITNVDNTEILEYSIKLIRLW